MFQVQTVSIFILIGILCFGLALWNRPFLRLLGLRPMSEVLTTPRYQRSARVTERLGRLCLVLMGISFVLGGLGPYLPQSGRFQLVKVAVVALFGMTLLAIIGVVLINAWARD